MLDKTGDGGEVADETANADVRGGDDGDARGGDAAATRCGAAAVEVRKDEIHAVGDAGQS